MPLSLLRRLGLLRPAIKNAAAVRAALDPFVQAVDPKLALLSNYRKVLQRPMSRLLDYADGFAARIPDPLELSLREFSMDPRLGMFFSSPVSLLATIDNSTALSEFFGQPRLGEVAYALLVMQRSEKSRFGIGEDNGVLRSDVLQTVVSFDAHRLTLAAPTLDDFAAALRQRGVQLLTEAVAARLAERDRRRQQLEADRQRLTLRVEAGRRNGECIVIDGTRNGGDEDGHDLDGLTAKLAEVESELAQLKAAAELPNRLAEVAELVGAPEQLLDVHRVSLHLDRMGIVQEEESANAQNLLCFEEVEMSRGAVARRVVVPVRVTRDAIRELEDSVDCT